MKYFRIFPAAAGVIALSAVTCFAQDQRDNEEVDASRIRVMVRSSAQKTPESSVPVQMDSKPGYIYFVEVEHGNKIKEVAIDAHTGKILGKRDITTKDV